MTEQELLQLQKDERNNYTKLIVESTEKNKLIIAGPGTGKTFTFKTLFETKNGSKLALTFINTLASDLQEKLGDKVESHTFHGYCKKLLHKISIEGLDSHFNYYPNLPTLIKRDGDILGHHFNEKDYENAFQKLEDNDERIPFYITRGNYYNSVSHNDAVYRVLKFFQNNPSSIPTFEQIVVDEYQDFNPLEIAFIEELTRNNPILIAGDDDQAIYDWKNASPDGIRSKALQSDFKSFELPYCSRCTEVIVDAVQDITTKARQINKLKNRIEKNYLCFLPSKKDESLANPKIFSVRCSVNKKKAPYVAMYIANEVLQIPQSEIDYANTEGYPSVLIIGPTHYTKLIYGYLSDKFSNINNPQSKSNEIDIIDGYKILMGDKDSNLGWRIILECVQYKDISSVIESSEAKGLPLIELLNKTFCNTHLAVVNILSKIKSSEEITNEESNIITKYCNHSVDDLIVILNQNLESEEVLGKITDNSIKIKLTTLNGSKGLSADYVFIVGMNNGDFPKVPSNITDNEICQLIVGLTRARKRCYLVSNSSFGIRYNIPKSSFIEWISSSRIEIVNINAESFRK